MADPNQGSEEGTSGTLPGRRTWEDRRDARNIQTRIATGAMRDRVVKVRSIESRTSESFRGDISHEAAQIAELFELYVEKTILDG